MVRGFLFVLMAALGWGPLAHAEQIFLDNFEGLAPGTVLTDKLRKPTVGLENSAGWISATGLAEARVVASLDGMAAEVVVPKGGTMDYIAQLGAEYGNGRFLVEWDFVVNQVNGGGGMFFVRFPTPEDSMQILFGFVDDGRLITFNGPPSDTSFVNVGSFTAGTRYAVRLLYDLSARRYSVALNGISVITNESIPTYLDGNSIDRFGFDINQSRGLPNQPAQGNQYTVDNVRFSHIEKETVVWTGPVSFSIKATLPSEDASGNTRFQNSTIPFTGIIELYAGESGWVSDEGGCFVRFSDNNGTDVCVKQMGSISTDAQKNKTDQLLLIGTGSMTIPIDGNVKAGPVYIDAKGTLKKGGAGEIVSISLSGKIGGGDPLKLLLSGDFKANLTQ